MIFLFVGSSGLTEASSPRDLAIPQLLLSSAWAIVPTMQANPMTVFPHRGLSPHQFTPMSGAHRLHRTPRLRLGCMADTIGAGSVSRNVGHEKHWPSRVPPGRGADLKEAKWTVAKTK